MTNVIWKSQNVSNQTVKRYRIVESIGWQVQVQPHAWSPPTDVYQVDDTYIVRVEIAGMHHQDFSIQIEDNYLIISGIRRDRTERRAYHQMEVRYGEFSTIVPIPGPINLEGVNAEYDDGLLSVILPKAK